METPVLNNMPKNRENCKEAETGSPKARRIDKTTLKKTR